MAEREQGGNATISEQQTLSKQESIEEMAELADNMTNLIDFDSLPRSSENI